MTDRFSDIFPGQPKRSAWQRFVAPVVTSVLHGAGRLLGKTAYLLDIRHRRIVVRNLQFAFPEKSKDEVRAIASNVFQHYGITVLEIIQSSWCRPETMLRRITEVEGRENLDALESDKGTILVTAHIGNWEVANQFTTAVLSRPLVAVARSIRNPALEKALVWFRTRFGGELINKKGAMPEMRRALKQGRTLALLVDQGAKSGEGVRVRFFNRDVRAHAVVAVLALRYGCPVVPAYCVRERHGFRAVIEPPIQIERTGDLRADIVSNTQKVQDVIEKAIRRYPEQWFWFHKRWRTFYPELYKKEMERKKRQRERRIRKKRKKSEKAGRDDA